MIKSITIVAIGFVGAAFAGSVHAQCTEEILSVLRDHNSVLLRLKGEDKFVNGVVISQEGLVLTVTSLLYQSNQLDDPSTIIWNKYRNEQEPLEIKVWTEPAEGAQVNQENPQVFSVDGHIVGFDAWRDLLLLKIASENLGEMHPISLAAGLDEGNAELCYASFLENDETLEARGGSVKLGDQSDDLGYWHRLGEPADIESEERGAGVYVIDGDNVSLYGILTHDHFRRAGAGVLAVQYANSLVAHLMYSTKNQLTESETQLKQMTERVRHLRVQPFHWDYAGGDSEDLDNLTPKVSKLRVAFRHSEVEEDILIKGATASWAIYGLYEGQEEADRLALSPDLHQMDITANDLKEDQKFDLQLQHVIDYLANSGVTEITEIEVRINTTFQIDGHEVTREWESENILNFQQRRS